MVIHSFYDNPEPDTLEVSDPVLKDKLKWASSRALIFITRGLKNRSTTTQLDFDFITPHNWTINPDNTTAEYLSENPDVPSGRLDPIPTIHFIFDRIWGDSIPEFHVMWSNLLGMLYQRNPLANPLCDTLSIDWNYLYIGRGEDIEISHALMTFKPPVGCRRLILHNEQCRQFGFNLSELAVPELLFDVSMYHNMNTYDINPVTELIMLFHYDKSLVRDLAIKIAGLNPEYMVYIGQAHRKHCIITLKNNTDAMARLSNYAELNPK